MMQLHTLQSSAHLQRTELAADIIGWDVGNWLHALQYWESKITIDKDACRIAEVGCAFGGLSLWFALKGYKVLCSDYKGVSNETKEIHKKYNVTEMMTYEDIDARSIPYENSFDIICYKSILGDIVRDGSFEVVRGVIASMKRALKPNGKLLFAENLSGTRLHQLLRQQYGSKRNRWRYFTIEEMKDLHADFSSFEFTTFGLTGCFGRNERQRKVFATIDQLLFERTIPHNWKYIIAGIATKQK
jgi:SAM-dependent methyltransferase